MRACLVHLAATLMLVPLGCGGSDERGGLDAQSQTSGDSDDSGSDGERSEHERIDAYIASLGTVEAAASETIEGPTSEPEPSDTFVCSTREIEEIRRFAEVAAFAGSGPAMYPGAVVAASSIDSGILTERAIDRAPLRLSASLEGVVDGSVSATLQRPSLSSFRDAMQEILQSRVIGQTPANVWAHIEQVHAQEQLSLALGAQVDAHLADVEASLGFDQTEVRSRFVVRFTQTYYTVDVDPPGPPSAFFAEGTTLAEVQAAIEDEPPAYVASVSYGRTVLFTVTSELSAQELQAALSFAYHGTASVDGSVSLTHEEVLERSQITAFILGGDGDAAVQAIYGVDELRAFIEGGGTWSLDSPAAPIAYKLAWMTDHTPARWSLSTDYSLTECSRATQNVRLSLRRLAVEVAGAYENGDLELYGEIGYVGEDGQPRALWSAENGDAIVLAEGSDWPQTGEIAAVVVPVTPSPGGGFEMYVELKDRDLNADDSFGHQVVARPYETGWRGEVAVPAAHEEKQIRVDFELMPVE